MLPTSSIVSIVSLNVHHRVPQGQDDNTNSKYQADITQLIELQCLDFGLNEHSCMSKLHRHLPQRSDSLFGRYGINIIAIDLLINTSWLINASGVSLLGSVDCYNGKSWDRRIGMCRCEGGFVNNNAMCNFLEPRSCWLSRRSNGILHCFFFVLIS